MLQGVYNIKDKLTKYASNKNTSSSSVSSSSKSSSISKQEKHDKQEIVEMKKNHKNLDEELRPLTFVHTGVKQLNGVKGVFVKEYYILSNMFSWNTQNVFGIFEADAQGHILNENSKPILYAVAKMNEDCSCESLGKTEFAITTQIDSNSSSGPFIYMKEERNCCGYNPCLVFINDNGNQLPLGSINHTYNKTLTLDNEYVKNLQISKPCFTCNTGCNDQEYNVSDDQGNKAIFIRETNCCSCTNPVSYRLGFPSSYNEDQKTLLLSMTIYMGFLNYKSRNSSKSSTSSHRK